VSDNHAEGYSVGKAHPRREWIGMMTPSTSFDLFGAVGFNLDAAIIMQITKLK
jgi:hypothetical protein